MKLLAAFVIAFAGSVLVGWDSMAAVIFAAFCATVAVSVARVNWR